MCLTQFLHPRRALVVQSSFKFTMHCSFKSFIALSLFLVSEALCKLFPLLAYAHGLNPLSRCERCPANNGAAGWRYDGSSRWWRNPSSDWRRLNPSTCHGASPEDYAARKARGHSHHSHDYHLPAHHQNNHWTAWRDDYPLFRPRYYRCHLPCKDYRRLEIPL